MSFLTGYVFGMTLNKSPNRSYHERDFEKEQLKIKCQEQENQIADISKKVERLQEQIKEANKLIKWCMKLGWSGNQEEDDFDRYCEKLGVK